MAKKKKNSTANAKSENDKVKVQSGMSYLLQQLRAESARCGLKLRKKKGKGEISGAIL